MKQTQVTIKDNLLNELGEVKHPGYATSLVLDYDRNMVKAKKSRIKEWDYYFLVMKLSVLRSQLQIIVIWGS